jgi:hypothetical protein
MKKNARQPVRAILLSLVLGGGVRAGILRGWPASAAGSSYQTQEVLEG